LNSNISASSQNDKNLDSNFGAIRVEIMHANFQASSFTGAGGGGGDRHTRDSTTNRFTKILNSPLRFGNEVTYFAQEGLGRLASFL